MSFNLQDLLDENAGRNYSLHSEHINPQFAKVLRLIGFDKCYDRAQGTHLWDLDGNKYLDMLSGYGVWNHGRSHPVIRKALIDFLCSDQPGLIQMEAPLLAGLLAEELKRRSGFDLGRVYFTSTGAEGNETVIKFARRATGKSRIVYAENAFHGLTNGALALNGSSIFRDGFGALVPDTLSVRYNDPDDLEKALAQGDVAAFIVEPVQGKSLEIATKDYLEEAVRLCRKYGTLFVADEVQSGIGRTGRFLSLQHAPKAEPDMVILSKSLSGGYVPVGAVLMRDWIHEKVFSSLDRAVVHSSTFGQGGLAMVAGLASLQTLDDDALLENAQSMGDLLGSRLSAMKSRYEFMKDVRWQGLMIGVEFGEPVSFKLTAAWKTINALSADLFCQGVTIPLFEDHRILTQVSGNSSKIIKLIPPLCLSESDVDWFCDGFEQVMAGLHTFPGPVWEGLARIGRNALPRRSFKATANTL